MENRLPHKPASCKHPAPSREEAPLWRRAYADAITRADELLNLLDLPTHLLEGAITGDRLFGLRVPRGFAARMRRGDPNDPLLRQVLPLAEEARETEGFSIDPVGDLPSMSATGVLHKYHGRVLLVATGACAVNCRYCFRRHFPYGDANASAGQWRAALDYIAADSSITEVILSGGDPLVLGDHKLAELTQQLERIPHLRRLRVHSRLPVVLPERIDEAMLDWLGRTRLQTVMVLHANHANELDHTVARACGRLAAAGASLLNQSVLLRGVNDSGQALANLSERLFDIGVMPYYLHVLDRVQGAAHFLVPEHRALRLHEQISRSLPGYLVPRLTREDAGASHKTWLLG
ncbi:MAG: EF-P beta-lysylation protein EpmB [Ectothiorhodospiraceae bacterium]|nr:EF-P beta-lysylation protein EpmB [Ectothiorhodospiraceae bacterium]MCH8504357.1 EF-P beta-lysylation protein EpmB [Ectothiorhodospiraceae bacterium]